MSTQEHTRKNPKVEHRKITLIANKNNDCGFEIEENGNELIHKHTGSINIVNVKRIDKRNDKIINNKNESIQFDKDMKKYGLQDKIMHIETLKTNIEKQFGPSTNDVPSKILFPFQKRNRSSSPPKESPINKFSVNRPNSPTPCKVIPMITHKMEFSFGKNGDFLNALETPKEEKCTADSNSLEDKKNEEENWMYKTYSKKEQNTEFIVNDKALGTLIGFLRGEEMQ